MPRARVFIRNRSRITLVSDPENYNSYLKALQEMILKVYGNVKKTAVQHSRHLSVPVYPL